MTLSIITAFKITSHLSSQFSLSVLSDSLRPHGLQHVRLPCPSPTPGAYSNSCLSRRWCHPTIPSLVIPLFLMPSIFPSIRVFSNVSVLRIRWPKYWSFSFNISPSNEYSGLISFRMDWLYILAVQGTLKSLLQHHSSIASILQRSTFFIVQLSLSYMTTGKAIALTKWTFWWKISLFFNMLSRLEKAMAAHSSTLAWKIHGQRSLVGCSPWGRWGSDTIERLHFHFSLSCIGEGNGNPLVFLPGESQGRGSLVGCRLWGRTESDMTEVT